MTNLKNMAYASAATFAVVCGMVAPAYAAENNVDYTDAVKVSWDGQDYVHGIAGSFIGMPVAVPGDQASRTLHVKNDGPTDGTMRVSIINVNLQDPESKDIDHVTGADDGNFYDDVKVSAATQSGEQEHSFTELNENKVTTVGEFPIEKGAVSDVNIGYDFPFESTSGNKANVDPRLASFDVLVEIGGKLPENPVTPEPTPTPTTTPNPGPSDSVTPSPDVSPTSDPTATETAEPTVTPTPVVSPSEGTTVPSESPSVPAVAPGNENTGTPVAPKSDTSDSNEDLDVIVNKEIGSVPNKVPTTQDVQNDEANKSIIQRMNLNTGNPTIDNASQWILGLFGGIVIASGIAAIVVALRKKKSPSSNSVGGE